MTGKWTSRKSGHRPDKQELIEFLLRENYVHLDEPRVAIANVIVNASDLDHPERLDKKIDTIITRFKIPLFEQRSQDISAYSLADARLHFAKGETAQTVIDKIRELSQTGSFTDTQFPGAPAIKTIIKSLFGDTQKTSARDASLSEWLGTLELPVLQLLAGLKVDLYCCSGEKDNLGHVGPTEDGKTVLARVWNETSRTAKSALTDDDRACGVTLSRFNQGNAQAVQNTNHFLHHELGHILWQSLNDDAKNDFAKKTDQLRQSLPWKFQSFPTIQMIDVDGVAAKKDLRACIKGDAYKHYPQESRLEEWFCDCVALSFGMFSNEEKIDTAFKDNKSGPMIKDITSSIRNITEKLSARLFASSNQFSSGWNIS